MHPNFPRSPSRRLVAYEVTMANRGHRILVPAAHQGVPAIVHEEQESGGPEEGYQVVQCDADCSECCWTTTYHFGCMLPDYSMKPEPLRMLRFLWWTVVLKLLELIETVFFVLRKKESQASFLHIYHHCSSLVIMFHESRGKHYSPGYGEGDTLGFLVVLPESAYTKYTPNTYKDRPLTGSKIYFFKNGECQGEAFTDVYQGCYYPTVSLHKNVTVSVNFGPNFKYPPSTEYKYRPCQGEAFTDVYQGCYYPTVSLHKNFTVSVNFGPNFKYPPSTEYKYRP
ncbi:putative trithorax protein ash2, partial [Operophtera brumata]